MKEPSDDFGNRRTVRLSRTGDAQRKGDVGTLGGEVNTGHCQARRSRGPRQDASERPPNGLRPEAAWENRTVGYLKAVPIDL